MKNFITRKNFIGCAIAVGTAASAGLKSSGASTSDVAVRPRLKSSNGTRWYRGMLHMHSHWSDGRALPEQAVAAYKDVG